MKEITRLPPYTIVLVCDFPIGQVPRILNLYRFFRKPPRIILVRRGGRVSADPGITVQSEFIPLPVEGLERRGIVHALSAICSAAGYLLYSCLTYLRIVRRRNSILLVHAHYIFPQGLFGLVLARLLRVPLVVSAVGQDVNEDMKGSAVLRVISRFVLSHARSTIAVSEPLHRALEYFGVSNSVYLPNSVDTNSIRPTSEPSLADSVLFVGVLAPRKGPLVLLNAFERVVREIPTAILIMVGKGPLAEVIQEEIRRKEMGDRVKLFPHVSARFLEDLFSQASVFVLPSLYEGLSLALLEAMAAGKVIVASANESNRKILQHESQALLFHPDDENDLAVQIERALTDKELRLRLATAARQLCVRDFSNTKIAPKLEEIYLAC
jgi:glycosyltransferase involved in cell wall biosynthesis